MLNILRFIQILMSLEKLNLFKFKSIKLLEMESVSILMEMLYKWTKALRILSIDIACRTVLIYLKND